MNGKSGIRLQLADYLKELLNKDILPVLPAADDMSALTAVANACKGEGSTTAAAAQQTLAAAVEAAGISLPGLSAAERAVLASGASAAAGVGSLVIVSARQLLTAVTAVSALSSEAAGVQASAGPLVIKHSAAPDWPAFLGSRAPASFH
jgi:histidine ammonia-lyase